MELVAAGRAVLMIAVASSAPWAVGLACGKRWAWPLDFGLTLRDGERLFGAHKTWRGLISGIALCAIVGWTSGLGHLVGAGIGATALAGDALSSAIKRRLHHRPGSEVPGLDQVPEALLPLLVFHEPLGISVVTAVVVTLAFTLLDLWLTPLRHIRR
jgi:CDP-2,3-bis-(O-geranylgeranyl)-sn-glycerol synthase